MAHRSLEDVVLDPAVIPDLSEDLELFRSSRDAYGKIGMPWHRCYLFEGPPGSGKTSLAQAISHHYNMNICILSLNSLKADRDLMQVVQGVKRHSILVIEDVDAFNVAKNREGKKESKTLTTAGLLNALDGIGTPDGLITVLTTNHADKLDPALVRSGRVDKTYHLGYVDSDQVKRMIERFCGEHLSVPAFDGNAKISPSDVMEPIKAHISDKPAGAKAVIAMIEEKLSQ